MTPPPPKPNNPKERHCNMFFIVFHLRVLQYFSSINTLKIFEKLLQKWCWNLPSKLSLVTHDQIIVACNWNEALLANWAFAVRAVLVLPNVHITTSHRDPVDQVVYTWAVQFASRLILSPLPLDSLTLSIMFHHCLLTLCERTVNNFINGIQGRKESAAVSVSAMFCIGWKKNFFASEVSTCQSMYPLGKEIHYSAQAHCIVMFSLSAQNGACMEYRPCAFTCGFHQGRSSLSQKMPFCTVTFQSCAIFLAFTTPLSCEYLWLVPFTDGKSKAQRDYMTCLKEHGWLMAEWTQLRISDSVS